MTHGTGSFAQYSSFGTVIVEFHPRFRRFLRYLELRLQLLGLESRENGFHLLGFAQLLGVQ
jgi:hypothetical protein